MHIARPASEEANGVCWDTHGGELGRSSYSQGAPGVLASVCCFACRHDCRSHYARDIVSRGCAVERSQSEEWDGMSNGLWYRVEALHELPELGVA